MRSPKRKQGKTPRLEPQPAMPNSVSSHYAREGEAEAWWYEGKRTCSVYIRVPGIGTFGTTIYTSAIRDFILRNEARKADAASRLPKRRAVVAIRGSK